MKAVENSATIIGLRCTDGVILASEKLIASELHMPGDCSRIFKVSTPPKNDGLVISFDNKLFRLTIILVWSVPVYFQMLVAL